MESLHPELQTAYERGLPEVCLPDVIFEWFEGNDSYWDDLSLLKLGFRYSPLAIRGIVVACMYGIHTENGYFHPPSSQFSLNAAAYGLFNDFITEKEFNLLLNGKVPRENYPQSLKDLWVDPYGRNIAGRVVPTLEEATLMVDGERKRSPSKKVIFIHGRWNGIPHAGQIYSIRNTVSTLNLEEEIPYEDMILVVACDTNHDIRMLGDRPFLNTAIRMSLISYLPWVDITCTSGNYEHSTYIKSHWWYKYHILRPDYVFLEIDDPNFEEKKRRIEEVGGKVWVSFRHSAYSPTRVGDPTLVRFVPYESQMSSTNLRDGTVSEWSLSNALAHLFTIKEIRDKLHGRRQWF